VLSVNCESRKAKLNVRGVKDSKLLEKDKQWANKP
jgi:hypothetical protein